jgi:DNA-binding transcriptional LysR family regulator
MDRFEQMRVFAGVVEAGGFTRAADRIGMSRAAISKHVLQLEDRLGARLLNRTTRHVAMTETGRAYYEKCRRILDEVHDAEDGVGATNAGPRGELRVVAPTNFGLVYIGSAITEFLLAYPELRIDLSLNDRPIDPVESGCDLSIRVAGVVPPSMGGLATYKITTSRRILCASPDYLARRGAPRLPDDLRDHECLSYSYVEEPRLWRLRGGGKDHFVPVAGRIVTSAGQVLRAAAARGLGIAYGPRVFFRDDLEAGIVAQVLPEYELPEVYVHSVFPASRHPSAKVATFNAYMRDFFEGRFL